MGRLARRSIMRQLAGWPELSPGAVNPWLLLITTKTPSWSDKLLQWPAGPPTLGTPHPGFFYPDPLGFWAEVRRWAPMLVRQVAPDITVADALSTTALLHVGHDAGLVTWAVDRCQPVVTLYLDEAARMTAGVEAAVELVSIPDPHRPGTVYEGWWAPADRGRVVGKSPQHPASHLLYRASDMDAFLMAMPSPLGD